MIWTISVPNTDVKRKQINHPPAPAKPYEYAIYGNGPERLFTFTFYERSDVHDFCQRWDIPLSSVVPPLEPIDLAVDLMAYERGIRDVQTRYTGECPFDDERQAKAWSQGATTAINSRRALEALTDLLEPACTPSP